MSEDIKIIKTTQTQNSYNPISTTLDLTKLARVLCFDFCFKYFTMMKKRQVVVKRSSDGSSSSSNRNSTSSSIVRNVVRYGECQKNHAANIGGYAVDGCTEFLANGEEGSNEALTCAACGCHRSFHRREVDTQEVVCEYSPPNA